MYLLFATLETVDISSPVISATSLSIIGLSLVSSPSAKYSFWYSRMAFMVSSRVFCLCFIASINHLAASSFCFTNITASRFCFPAFLSREYDSSISEYPLLTFSSGIFLLLRLNSRPLSDCSRMKSGMICCAVLV